MQCCQLGIGKNKLETSKINIMKLLLNFLVLLITTITIGQNTYLYCGKLIDTKNGKVLTNKTIIVSGKKIIAVEDGFSQPKSADDIVIDLKTKTVMPGLIDMHVHLENEYNPKVYLNRFTDNDADIAFKSAVYAKETLNAGFTTVRDLGGTGVNISLRNAINSGLVDGPRIFTAGKIISSTGGHGDPTNGMRKDLTGDPGPREGVINSVDDAKKAIDIGCSAIMISNHGGRQLDGSRAPFDQLSEIVDAVGDKIEVILDGGIRRGTHVLKALALGAKACSFGKGYLFALGAAGQKGVEAILQKMKDEINRDMILMGCKSVKDLNRSKVAFRKNQK